MRLTTWKLIWLLWKLSRGGNRARQRRAGVPQRTEALESRVLLSTLTVRNLNDSGPGSLRDAVATANSQPGQDTIEFHRGLRGSIVLTTGQMEITDSLVITGPGAARVSISGNNSSRIFRIQAGQTVSLSDLSLVNGRQTTTDELSIPAIQGGAILNTGSTLSLNKVTFTNNRAEALGDGFGGVNVVDGGAIANIGQATLEAKNCTFQNNKASGGTIHAFGGAISNLMGASVETDNCLFSQNVATGSQQNYGGAVGKFGVGNYKSQNSSYILNSAMGLNRGTTDRVDAFGGAVAVWPGTDGFIGNVTTFESCRFVSNRAEAAASSAGGTGTGGTAAGGAIYVLNSSLSIDGSTLLGNVVQGGQGITTGGMAFGGGVAAEMTSMGRPISIIKSLVQGNVVRAGTGPSAIAMGGGLSLAGFVSLAETRVICNGLQAGPAGMALGGGVYLGTGSFTFLTDSRLAGNVASGQAAQGGGLYSLGTNLVSPQVASQTWRLAQGNVARGLVDNIFGTLTPSTPPPV